MPLSAYYPLCDAIALLLQPQAEVVLHDLATETVSAIDDRIADVPDPRFPRGPGSQPCFSKKIGTSASTSMSMLGPRGTVS